MQSESPATSSVPASSRPSPPARPASRAPLVIAVAALAVSLGVWWQTRLELGSIRQTQRELSAEVSAAKGMPTIDTAGAPVLGSNTAPVTMIEFADYECPFCIRHFTQTMPQIEANYIRTGKVRYIFRDFPIDSLHPGAFRAHEAAGCAAAQQKYWELHTRLFSAPGSHTDENLAARASEAGLKMDDFGACLTSGRTAPAIRQSVAAVTQLGANGTPTFFFGVREKGTDQIRVVQAMAGAQPYSEFEKMFATVAKVAERE